MNSSKFTWVLNNSTNNDSDDELLNFNRYKQEPRNYLIAIFLINVVLSFTALLGNSAILITISKTSSLHSASNILLSSLAVSDLGVGLVVQPLFAALFIGNGLNSAVYFNTVSSYMLCTVSFFTVTAIAVDRLLALQLHLRYEAVVTQFRATVVIICIWVLSGLFIILWLFNLDMFLKVVPVVIITTLAGNRVVYLKIYLIVRRHQRQIQQQQQNNPNILNYRRFIRSALNTFLVFIILLCCYMPYSVIVGMALHGGVFFSSNLYITTITLLFLNSSLNPLFYSWRDREIRTAMKQLFFRCF